MSSLAAIPYPVPQCVILMFCLVKARPKHPCPNTQKGDVHALFPESLVAVVAVVLPFDTTPCGMNILDQDTLICSFIQSIMLGHNDANEW